MKTKKKGGGKEREKERAREKGKREGERREKRGDRGTNNENKGFTVNALIIHN